MNPTCNLSSQQAVNFIKETEQVTVTRKQHIKILKLVWQTLCLPWVPIYLCEKYRQRKVSEITVLVTKHHYWGIGNFVQNTMCDCSTESKHLGQVIHLALVALKWHATFKLRGPDTPVLSNHVFKVKHFIILNLSFNNTFDKNIFNPFPHTPGKWNRYRGTNVFFLSISPNKTSISCHSRTQMKRYKEIPPSLWFARWNTKTCSISKQNPSLVCFPITSLSLFHFHCYQDLKETFTCFSFTCSAAVHSFRRWDCSCRVAAESLCDLLPQFTPTP